MWRSVSILALVLSLPAGAIAGEARAVMQVGITITGKDPNSKPVVAPAARKSALQPAAKPSTAK